MGVTDTQPVKEDCLAERRVGIHPVGLIDAANACEFNHRALSFVCKGWVTSLAFSGGPGSPTNPGRCLGGFSPIQLGGAPRASLAPAGRAVSVLLQGWPPKLVAHGRDSASAPPRRAPSHVAANFTGQRGCGRDSGGYAFRRRVALALLPVTGVAKL